MIELAPSASVWVEKVARPLETCPVPSTVVPLDPVNKNCTVPVGVLVLEPIAATVAVKFTACPKTGEVVDGVRVVVDVADWATVTETGGEVAPDWKLESPW